MEGITVLLTLTGLKIISVNDLYKAKLGYKYGKPYPVIYKNPKAKEISQRVFSQMSSIEFTEDQLEFLRTCKNYSITYNFIVKSGINSRDLGNFEKQVTDTLVNFVNQNLGITTFDDSQITEIHMTKSIIPKASAEYIALSLTPSKHNPRFDSIDEPKKIYFVSEERDDLVKILKKHIKTPEHKDKKLGILVSEDGEKKLEKCNTRLYVIDENTPNVTTELLKISFEIKDCIYHGQDFIWLYVNEWSDGIYDEIKGTVEYLKSLIKDSGRVKIVVGQDITEILN